MRIIWDTQEDEAKMCYAVMVETDLKRLQRDFDATVDVAGLHGLLVRRSQGEKNLKIPEGFEDFFASPQSQLEEDCRRLLEEHASAERQRLSQKVDLQRTKIAELEARLAAKATKTAADQLATARRVLAKAEVDLGRLGQKNQAQESLIHQYTYAPLLVRDERGQRWLRFFRYQVRPRWAETEPHAKVNLFNARLDGLEERRTWAPLFMARHGALVFRSFNEWVTHPATGQASIIHFFAKDGARLWVPALHETYQASGGGSAIDSFAILTTAPPPSVEKMGHDRCPLVRSWDFLPEWLDPKRSTRSHLLDELWRPVTTEFDYRWGPSVPATSR